MAATMASIAYSSQVTHIGSGASLAPAGISGSADISVALVGTGNLARYPLCDIVLTVSPTASIASTSTAITILRRDLNVDGTADETIPDASNVNKFAAALVLRNATTVSTTHVLQAINVVLPGCDCEFYVQNNLGVNIPAGWTLKVTPKTIAVE